MKNDILNAQDIKNLVDNFYEKVKKNEQLAPFFGQVHWQKHLPVMYIFWENVLFHTGEYEGNPLQSHQRLHKKNPIQKNDFEQWVTIFIGTVDELFEGENAQNIKQRASNIATVMSIKIQ